jgi:excisionase family DNA binding protein
MDDDWLTSDEARERLRVGRTKFYELLLDGQIPGAVRLGRTWRIHWPTLLRSWACQPPGRKE